ncbi:hypothetical protein K461DRAFT_276659 [Myriangium duriaei CBS 260.36]|uniref:ESPR domain-containing protein n=1 Tax=Myriangium duriaei CBS 260.36 TaxID=1168546 RepID=A0A9P4MI15_9PEZI|nr:hypothetical protein K461DRAFT_276659 [Myriangium duriaei CBS 260.36]
MVLIQTLVGAAFMPLAFAGVLQEAKRDSGDGTTNAESHQTAAPGINNGGSMILGGNFPSGMASNSFFAATPTVGPVMISGSNANGAQGSNINAGNTISGNIGGTIVAGSITVLPGSTMTNSGVSIVAGSQDSNGNSNGGTINVGGGTLVNSANLSGVTQTASGPENSQATNGASGSSGTTQTGDSSSPTESSQSGSSSGSSTSASKGVAAQVTSVPIVGAFMVAGGLLVAAL